VTRKLIGLVSPAGKTNAKIAAEIARHIAQAQQRPTDVDVVSIGRPLGQPEERPVDPEPVAGVGVVLLGLVGVADLQRLCRREVARLLERHGVESPAKILAGGRHSISLAGHKLNEIFSFIRGESSELKMFLRGVEPRLDPFELRAEDVAPTEDACQIDRGAEVAQRSEAEDLRRLQVGDAELLVPGE